MSFFSKDKISIARQDPNQIAIQGGQAAQKLSPVAGQLFQEGVGAAGQAAGGAAQAAFDINTQLAPQIREQQQALNAQLFSGVGEQERLAGGDIATGLESMARERLGKGLTEREERDLRESSRQAFTSRGLFRSNPALVDEIVSRQQADRQAQLQNAQFAQGVLGFRSNLLQQPIQNRQAMFLDPRSASGINAGQIMGHGAGIGGQAFGAGVGISQTAAKYNQAAQAEEAIANQGGGLFGDALTMLGGAIAPTFGAALGGPLAGGLMKGGKFLGGKIGGLFGSGGDAGVDAGGGD